LRHRHRRPRSRRTPLTAMTTASSSPRLTIASAAVVVVAPTRPPPCVPMPMPPPRPHPLVATLTSMAMQLPPRVAGARRPWGPCPRCRCRCCYRFCHSRRSRRCRCCHHRRRRCRMCVLNFFIECRGRVTTLNSARWRNVPTSIIGDVNYQYYQTSGVKRHRKWKLGRVFGKATITSG
jgi:hypothetical protein